jgi:hypothetical protein
MLGGDDPNEPSESTGSTPPDAAGTDESPPASDAGETAPTEESRVAPDREPSGDVWAPDAPLAAPPAGEPEPLADDVDDTAAAEESSPAAEPARATFSDLAREQAVRAEEEDADTDRVRELGLDSLPKIDDDLLPGH